MAESNAFWMRIHNLTCSPDWPALVEYMEKQQESLAGAIDRDRNPDSRNEMVGKRLMAEEIKDLKRVSEGILASLNLTP